MCKHLSRNRIENENCIATETLTCSLYRYRLGNDCSIHLSYRGACPSLRETDGATLPAVEVDANSRKAEWRLTRRRGGAEEGWRNWKTGRETG